MKRIIVRGFASIPLLVFMLVAVTFVMTQAYYTTTSRLGDDVNQSNSIAAFFVAESGIETGTALLTTAADQAEFDLACDSFKRLSVASLGRGTATYKWQNATSDTDAEISSCTFRVTGRVGNATRTIEKLMEYRVQRGLAGFSEAEVGSNRTSSGTLKVKSSSTAVAILASAYRIKGSEGYDDLLAALGLDGNATSSPACGNCSVKWELESSSGGPSVGSIAIAETLSAGETFLRQQIYTVTGKAESPTPRNYVQVGALVKGTNPKLEGVYAKSGDTSNNNMSDPSTGIFINGSARDGEATKPSGCDGVGGSCACYRSDLLIFAASGRVTPQNLIGSYSGSFDSVTFDTSKSGYTGYQVPMQLLVHFPATNEPTPGAQGDLFAEMWYVYNPYLYATIGASSTISVSGNRVSMNIAIASGTPKPAKETYIRFFNTCSSSTGSGKTKVTVACNLDAGAKIIDEPVQVDATTYKVTVPKPSGLDAAAIPSAWANKTICGGICALQPTPSTASTAAEFQIVRNASSNQALRQFAGGLLCLSGVGSAPGTISRQQVATKRWREITSDDQ